MVLRTMYRKWNFIEWQAPIRDNCTLCFYEKFIFSGIKCHRVKKKIGILKSRLLHKVAANQLLIARDRFSQRVRDRSIRQFVQRWASGSAISKIVRLRSFSLPEALYRGNAIYWQSPCLRWKKKKKKHTCVHTHIHACTLRPGTTWR